ncbi:hypothetical protein [Paenibacillus senegalensis]|uniref:hypothetical protein n=1 Tax=Paenibacillus senegalensis TaxID=1465766 RepID=UPI000289522F|nr:hypothetical protein [Paenibacillus senegalensis]
MISDEQLDRYRQEGIKVRVIRDDDPANDVRGFIMAWDDSTVLLKKFNRRVVKLDRSYTYQPSDEERISPL